MNKQQLEKIRQEITGYIGQFDEWQSGLDERPGLRAYARGCLSEAENLADALIETIDAMDADARA